MKCIKLPLSPVPHHLIKRLKADCKICLWFIRPYTCYDVRFRPAARSKYSIVGLHPGAGVPLSCKAVFLTPDLSLKKRTLSRRPHLVQRPIPIARLYVVQDQMHRQEAPRSHPFHHTAVAIHRSAQQPLHTSCGQTSFKTFVIRQCIEDALKRVQLAHPDRENNARHRTC